jgi:hypothetical protein
MPTDNNSFERFWRIAAYVVGVGATLYLLFSIIAQSASNDLF